MVPNSTSDIRRVIPSTATRGGGGGGGGGAAAANRDDDRNCRVMASSWRPVWEQSLRIGSISFQRMDGRGLIMSRRFLL